MHFQRHGAGKPLLLIHGLGSSLRNWDPIMSALMTKRDVIAVDLPGFGHTPPLAGPVTMATLTDAVADFIEAEDLGDIDIVGSSMGARMVLELARRGHGGTVVALDPGGFWNDRQARIFAISIKASVWLVRKLQPILPLLTRNPITRTALLAQFSAHPWRLPQELVLHELRGFDNSPSLDEALNQLAYGPRQEGAHGGSTSGRVVIGWGRRDLVTATSESRRATEAFPEATLHWFEHCGHFPHWDQPDEAAALILSSTAGAGAE